MSLKIPHYDPKKPVLDADTKALVTALRSTADALEAGEKIDTQKARVRHIVDLVMKLSGYNAIMRAMVVNSKYLK